MTSTAQHVVLGANGIIGQEAVRALLRRGETVASVGRRPATVDGATSVIADLLTPSDVARALTGARVAYLTAGLPYSASTWAQQWPVIVDNTIEAAITHGTHLVYVDNVYAYGLVDGPMTEQTPVRPVSSKGRTRAAALAALRTAAADRGLSVTVARSADFYGPGATTSVFTTFGLARIAAGKRGTWFFDADQPHSLTYTPDIGEALAVLGTHPGARGDVWHLPTAPALTGREYLELAGPPGTRPTVMSRATMRLGALFSTPARETLEMSYQYTAPSVVDSRAFESAFGVTPTPIADGFAATLAALRAGR